MSGDYRIELAGPRFWVLSFVRRRARRPQRQVTILRSAESLKRLKAVAEVLEQARLRRRHVMTRSLAIVLLSAVTLILLSVEAVFVIPCAIAITAVSLPALVQWIESSSAAGWSSLSESYQ